MNPLPEADVNRRVANTPIAIVGLSALYPKSRDLHEFWGNIVAAADCIEDVPDTHWDVTEHYDPDPAAPDKTYSKRGGFIPPVPFNPMEFGLPPNTLEVTDVLQLLSLVVARDLLKDAGADQPWYDASRTGVVLGVTGANQLTQPLSARLQTPVLKEVVRSCGLSERDAEEIAEKFTLAFAPWEENSFPGMLGNVVAGRIANRLDLGGINMTIDAACASSLAAVKAAVSELVEGRADTMLAGGCDAENTIFMYLCFSKTPAFSKTGRIRPFDKEADGTLIGEGIGMLALRRLADAERDGNRIYAVIRGIGSSSDGRFKSIYAPRKEGQVAALRRAYADADCSPASVELFEAHGTGTAVGDATELSALAAVVADSTDAKQYAAVGSVKSQIGHTKAAAGAAGLIKLALSLHHKVLPPTINVSEPSPALDFANSPFYVNTQTRPWIRDPHRPRRRAAISSFGFGGTNFHFVLEEHSDGDAVRMRFPVAAVHLWHAPDTAALIRLLDEGGEPTDGPVPSGHARVALAAVTAEELAALREVAVGELRARPDAEAWAHPKGVYFRRRAARTGKVAALFAGQGSQYVNPGRTAVQALPPLRAAFDRANLEFADAVPLSRVAFPAPAFTTAGRQAQEEALRRTEYAQPAIGALSTGQFRYLTELGFSADGFLGHSFGELTALWAAGALDDDAYFALARARGAAMAPPDDPEFDPGAMAAVSAPETTVAELLCAHPTLTVCNRNAPDQLVVGGATEAVEQLVSAAQGAGVQATRLPVSAAFHTPYVGHAVDAFRGAVDAVQVRAPRRPVFANTPGAVYGTDVAANRRVLAEQLIHPVHFADRVEEMYAAGFRTFVEFGPKGVLTRLVGRILGERDHTVLALDPGPGGDADLSLKRAVAQLAVLGLPLTTADRYVAAPPPREPAQGMTVWLNGINYVSDARKAAYRDAIDNGYRVTLPAAPAPAPVPRPQPAAEATVMPQAPPPAAPDQESVPMDHEPRPAPTAPPEDGRLTDLIADHLALHDDYLTGQLDSTRRLVGLLERAAEQGRLTEVIPGVTAVKEHGLAIGRTHLRANEVLRELAGFELGGADAAAVRRPAPRISGSAAVQDTPARVQPPAPPAQPTAAPVRPAPVPAVLPAASPAHAEPAAAMASPPTPVDEPPAAPRTAPPATAGAGAAEVKDALLSVVAQKTGYPPEMLETTMDVEADLGIDSIKRVEIMGVLQERFPSAVTAGPEELGELRTLGDIIDFITGATAPADTADPTVTTPRPAPGPVTVGTPRPAPGPAVQPSRATSSAGQLGRAHAALVDLPAADRLVAAYPEGSGALVVDDGGELAAVVAARLVAEGWRVHVLRLPGVPERMTGVTDRGLSGWGVTELAERVDEIVADRVRLVLQFTTRQDTDWADGIRRLSHALLLAKCLVTPLTSAAESGRAAFVTVTRLDGAFGIRGVDEAQVPAGGLGGLTKTLAVEAPELFCRAVDLCPSLGSDAAAALVLEEAHDAASAPVQVGHDGSRRVTLSLADRPLDTGADNAGVPGLTSEDLLVVTGGGRGITARCVVDLAGRYRPGLLLLGRTALGEDPGWARAADGVAELKAAAVAHLRATGEKPTPKRVDQLSQAVAGQREIRQTLADVRAAGSRVEYLQVDITDAAATASALAPYAQRITGLVHGAGVLADQLIAAKKASEIDRVFAAKLGGLRAVLEALPTENLRHVVLFSSVAGFFGNRGQSDYAMANEVLNAWAAAWKRSHPGARVTALNWGAWDSGMVSPQIKAVFQDRGIPLIPVSTGTGLFSEQFEPGRADDVITVLGPTTPLSVREARLPAAATVVERRLDPPALGPIVTDHVIGGVPVLPAAVALGWAVGAVERVCGGMVRRIRDFAVHQGVVFDGTENSRFQLEATPADDRTTLEVAIRSLGPDGRIRPHYAATVALGTDPAAAAGPPSVTGLPLLGGGRDAAGFYTDGTLFHGESLRGLRRVLADEESRLVLECGVPEHRPAGGAFNGALYAPGPVDLLLQAALVWTRLRRDTASLPLSVARADLYSPFPADGDPFLAVVEPDSVNGATTTLTVTACTPDGRVLTRLGGVSVVSAPQLAAKFVSG